MVRNSEIGGEVGTVKYIAVEDHALRGMIEKKE